jgi:hypothetical protein
MFLYERKNMKKYLFSLLFMTSAIVFGFDGQFDSFKNRVLAFDAIKTGNKDLFDRYLSPEDGMGFLNPEKTDCIDLLGIAAMRKGPHTQYFIQKIIAAGANPNFNWTNLPVVFNGKVGYESYRTLFPLERAIEHGNVDAVVALLNNGADIQTSSFQSESLFSLSSFSYPTPLEQAKKYLSISQDRSSDDAPGTAEAPGTRAEYKQIIAILQSRIDQNRQEEFDDVGGMGCSIQ